MREINCIVASGESPSGGYDWSGYYIYYDGRNFAIEWDSGCSCNGPLETAPTCTIPPRIMFLNATEKRDARPLYLVANPKDENYSELMDCYEDFLRWYHESFKLKVSGE